TWQQSGRAGRRNDESATFMVANSSPLSQFIIRHPEYFFGTPPENGLLNANNLFILINHIKCAAFELPFHDSDTYGGEDIIEILEYLEELGVLRHVGQNWHWATDEYPSADISLRSASNDNFVIIETSNKAKPKVIGKMDRFTVPMLLHEEAIYLHQGEQYQVEKLDFEEKKAFVRSVNVDYYTDADLAVSLKVLDCFEEEGNEIQKNVGEVMVTSMVTMFKKIKFDTHENLGWGKVKLPELEMHTTSFWISLSDDIAEKYEKQIFQNAMLGICNVIANIAPVYLMCETSDISVIFQVRSPFTGKATIFIYDNIPGGIGFSQKLFEMDTQIYQKAVQLIQDCSCLDGCPSCVGPDNSDKKIAKKLLEVIIRDS
ncbi:MAG: DEAD/DEAH box helicase, partial [Clostridiales bacterium]|nr:DEAD/DEAH box helicase [Clostridiales bacterium]